MVARFIPDILAVLALGACSRMPQGARSPALTFDKDVRARAPTTGVRGSVRTL